MKKILFLIGVLILLLVTSSYSKEKPLTEVTILSINKQMLYFKVSKSFIGGVVEVYDANERFLEAERLPHTHTMIYFEEVPKGIYTIRVRNGELCTEFKYDNN